MRTALVYPLVRRHYHPAVPAAAARTHGLAAGGLEVHGTGRAAEFLAAHLGPPNGDRAVWVTVELRSDAAPEPVVVDGDPVRVTCRPTVRTMAPFLDAIRLAAERRGARLVAGAAVSWAGRAVVLQGPSGAGKTGAALRAIERGAVLVSPEWSWVAGGATLWPLPQPVRLRPHHRSAGVARGRLTPIERARLSVGGRLPARVARRAFVDVPLVRFNASAPSRSWPLAGTVDVTTGPVDAVVDEAERLARTSAQAGESSL